MHNVINNTVGRRHKHTIFNSHQNQFPSTHFVPSHHSVRRVSSFVAATWRLQNDIDGVVRDKMDEQLNSIHLVILFKGADL
jgi:hypothetical protein